MAEGGPGTSFGSSGPDSRELLETLFNKASSLARSPWTPHGHIIPTFRKLLEQEGSMDSKDDDGHTLTGVAVENKSFAMMDVIFHMGLWSTILKSTIRSQDNAFERFLQFLDEWEASLSKAHKYARAGNATKLEKLLQENPEMTNSRDGKGGSCLYWACVGGNLRCVEILLDLGASIDVETDGGENILHTICRFGNNHLIDLLLEKCGRQSVLPILQRKNRDRRNPLHTSAQNGNLNFLLKFEEIYPGLKLDISGAELAIKHKNVEYLTHLIKSKLPKEHMPDDLQEQARNLGVETGNTQLSNILGQRKGRTGGSTSGYGTGPSFQSYKSLGFVKDGQGISALGKAAAQKDVQAFERLLREEYHQILIDEKSCFDWKSNTFKHQDQEEWKYVYINRPQQPAYQRFTAARTSMPSDTEIQRFGGTVLCQGKGSIPDNVHELVPEGVISRLVPPADADDMSPLAVIAQHRGRCEVFRGDPSMTGTLIPPSGSADQSPYMKCARMLLLYGADPNCIDAYGSTVAHIAAAWNDKQLLDLLFQSGADYNAKDHDGNTVYDITKCGVQVADPDEANDEGPSSNMSCANEISNAAMP